MFLLILTLIAVALFLFAVWYFSISNKFIVEPRKRERLVIQNVKTGRTEVLGRGTHFRSPYWKELLRIDASREPIRVPAKPGDRGEEFRTKDNVLGLIEYRFDIVAGRANDTNGRVKKMEKISHAVMKRAVTQVDYDKHKEFVGEKVESAIENVFRQHDADELFRPSTDKDDTGRANILRDLGQEVQKAVDLLLLLDGFNVLGFKISNIKPASADTEKNIEKKYNAGLIAEGAKAAIDGSGDELTYQEALVSDNQDALAKIRLANAIESGAKAIGEGFKALGIGAGEIGKGLKKP